jgi:hypothetical protein
VETTMVDVYVTHARAYKQVPVHIGDMGDVGEQPPEPLPPVRARQYTLIDLEVEWQEQEEPPPTLASFDPLDRAPPSEGLRTRGWGIEENL